MDFNVRMKEAREAIKLSREDVTFCTREYLTPAQYFRTSTLRRLETDTPEDKADPGQLWALSQVYGVTLESLSPLAAEWLTGTVAGFRGTGTQDGPSPTWRNASPDPSVSVAA